MKRPFFLISYLALFLAAGLLHVFLYGVPFTDSFMLLLYGSTAFLWAISLSRRIMDARIRRLLVAIAVMIELFFVLQICNYRLFTQNIDMKRHCWYAYYVPMCLVPLLVFYLSMYLNLPEDRKLSKKWAIPGIFMTVIAVLFPTNDLHFLVFRFHERPMTPNTPKTYMPVYYIFAASAVILLIAAFAIILRKCRVTISRRLAWVPVVPLAIGIGLLVLELLGHKVKLRGIILWNMGEIFFFMSFGFLESCIRIGLIPANTEYESIFRRMNIPVKLCGPDLRPALIAGGGEPKESEYMRLEQTKIRGGSVIWGVDVGEIKALDKQIRQTTEQITARNEYLRSENELKEEITALEARNRTYDRIATLLKPQLDRIELLLSEAQTGDFSENLKKISVLNAYVKRRSNLALLDTGQMPFAELTLAIEESLNYLDLCGVETMLLAKTPKLPAGQLTILLPGELVTGAYDFFEQVLELLLDQMKACAVTAAVTEEEITLRMMCSGENINWNPEALAPKGGHVEICQQDTDIQITLTLPRAQDFARQTASAQDLSAQKGGDVL